MKHTVIPFLALLILLALASCSAGDGYTYIVKGTDADNDIERGLPPSVNTEAGTVSTDADTLNTYVDTSNTYIDTESICTVCTETDISDASAETTAKAAESTVTVTVDRSIGTALKLVDFTKTVKPGQNGSVTIRGTAGTKYSIRVLYSSGPSSAKGLEDKTAGSNGTVTWKWKIGTNTKPGKYEITVSGGGETLSLTFAVE